MAAHLPRSANASEPPINPNPMIAILDSERLKSGLDMLRNQVTIYRFSHCLDLLNQFGKCFWCERLLAIRDRMRGIGMHFNDDTIRARGNTGLRNGRDISRVTSGVA